MGIISQSTEKTPTNTGLKETLSVSSLPASDPTQTLNIQNNAPQTAASADNNGKMTKQDEANYRSRWFENARFFGELPEAIVANEISSDNTEFNSQTDGVIATFSGFLIAGIFHKVFKSKYKKSRALNPLYRNFKTLATAGTNVGLIFYDLRMLPQILATAIFSLAIGLLAIPYWAYRKYYLKNPNDEHTSNTKLGSEGWSKYAKTFLVFGMYLGEVIGNFVSFIARGDYLRNIAIFGAVGSIVTFIVGVIAVPLINKIYDKKLISSQDTFRNNYVRSGITLGVAVGSIIGFILGTFAFPGLGSMVGMAVGAAFCSVIGGVVLGMYGKNITNYLQSKWKVPENTDNSWDYSSRNTSYLFGFIGAAIGFFIPVPGGALLGTAIGSAVGSAIGWGAGFFIIRAARRTSITERKALTLPWTQRIANGTMVGSMIGAAIGFCIGLAGGPVGAMLGATLGFSVGAIIGGIGYGLYDKTARTMLRHYFAGTTIPAEEKTREIVSAPIVTRNPIPSQTTHTNVMRKFSSPQIVPLVREEKSPAPENTSPTSPSKRKIRPSLTINTTHRLLELTEKTPLKKKSQNFFSTPQQVFQKESEAFSYTAIPVNAY